MFCFAFTLHIQKKLAQGLTVQYDYNAYFKICRINANAINKLHRNTNPQLKLGY